jgi:cytochrome c-type biogenesis protein
MLEELFTYLTLGLTGTSGLAAFAAFGWGVASILLSPCHLSSIPLIVGYISTEKEKGSQRTFTLALLFALGILATITLVGALTAVLGRILGDVGFWGNLVVASVFFVMGLNLLDVVHLPWLAASGSTWRGRGKLGALMLGLIFGLGLGPCTFAFLAPVLGVVFSIASTDSSLAALLLGSFIVGHCSVIVAAGSLGGLVSRYLTTTRGTVLVRKAAGVLVLLAGTYFVVTNLS